MRIMLVSDFFPPFIGGAEQVIADTAAELAARGHRVAVVTLWHDGLARRESIQGVEVHRLDGAAQQLRFLFSDPGRRFHPPLLDPVLTFQLRRIVARFRPQIVHGQSWMLMSILPLQRTYGFKTVSLLQDYSHVCPKKTMLWQEAAWCSHGLSRHCFSCAAGTYGFAKGALATAGLVVGRMQSRRLDAYVAISSYAADMHRRYGNRGSVPLYMIPNFVRDSVVQTPPSAPLPGLPAEYILFLGALGWHKGVHILLEAYRRLHTHVPLVMIGAAQATTPMDLPPGALMVKGLPHADVLRAIDHCRFLVSPALWPEPFGIVAIEGMARGKAVVASRAGGLADIVREGYTGLLAAPGDATALSAAMGALVANPALVARMGEHGRARCRETYVASVVIPSLVGVYKHVYAC
jgi:glycosyltransferase involved in cell wall biosynthesis